MSIQYEINRAILRLPSMENIKKRRALLPRTAGGDSYNEGDERRNS